ncbi:class I SAM-dependent methyltransferase [Vitreimonas sp.]|uniref:class I SAM-dependent methyltransferase n=1 Tax=Vitreimonas sp. TaxID=3069702 RepID=UPI002EDB159C
MLDRIKRSFNGLRSLVRSLRPLPTDFERFQLLVFTSTMTPIDRHVALYMATRKDAIFAVSYAHWRTKRINKILELYGMDWFKGKRVLELGSALSDIGAFFADLGAEVICLEGRQETVNFARLKHRNVPRLQIEQCDLEGDFSHYGKFDLIIHFGLLYHIKNVDEHMARCFAMTDSMIMETVVCDSQDPHKMLLVPEPKAVLEQSLHGMGSRPSPFYVERLGTEAGFKFDRHFTADLNFEDRFIYDWPHQNDDSHGDWQKRRFWRFDRA